MHLFFFNQQSGIVGGAYYMYCMAVYPHMPNMYVAGWHRHAGFALMMFCLFSWLMCSIKDPGIITEWNVDSVAKQYLFCLSFVFYVTEV